MAVTMPPAVIVVPPRPRPDVGHSAEWALVRAYVEPLVQLAGVTHVV